MPPHIHNRLRFADSGLPATMAKPKPAMRAAVTKPIETPAVHGACRAEPTLRLSGNTIVASMAENSRHSTPSQYAPRTAGSLPANLTPGVSTPTSSGVATTASVIRTAKAISMGVPKCRTGWTQCA